MKKKVAGALLLLTLGVGAISSTAYATTKCTVQSPVAVTVTPPPTTPHRVTPPGGGSPKTADINILGVEGLGLAAAGVAVVTGKRKRYEK